MNECKLASLYMTSKFHDYPVDMEMIRGSYHKVTGTNPDLPVSRPGISLLELTLTVNDINQILGSDIQMRISTSVERDMKTAFYKADNSYCTRSFRNHIARQGHEVLREVPWFGKEPEIRDILSDRPVMASYKGHTTVLAGFDGTIPLVFDPFDSNTTPQKGFKPHEKISIEKQKPTTIIDLFPKNG